MGMYLINGVPTEVPGNPTAAEVKRHLHKPNNYSVVITLPDNTEHLLQDNELIPYDATDVSIIPQFRYGSSR
jgi:hypothetical protein